MELRDYYEGALRAISSAGGSVSTTMSSLAFPVPVAGSGLPGLIFDPDMFGL